MKFATPHHLMLSLRMSVAVYLLPLYAFMVWTGTVYLFCFIVTIIFLFSFFFCLNRTQESEKLRRLSLSVLQSLKQLRADVINEEKLRQLGNFDLCSQMVDCYKTVLT